MKISGYICIRNGTILDYCWELALQSLIPVCDEVLLSVGTGEDDTKEKALEWERQDSRVRVADYRWDNPRGDIEWWVRWLNAARGLLTHPMQLTLDGDEVICPGSYPEILSAAERMECRWFHRLNFWKDPQHIAPHGRVCGEAVVRLCPTELTMVSDEPRTPEAEIRTRAGWPPNPAPSLRIFHYGFLREPAAFFKKVRIVNGAFFDTYDDRLQRAEDKAVPWEQECPFDRPLLEYNGPHPQIAHQWLKERGYQP